MRHRSRPPSSSRERGIALMIVLMLALVLIPFAVEFAYQIQIEAQMSLNVTHQLMLDKAIDGQREIVLAQLEYDAPNNETDTYDDDWNRDEIRKRTEEMGSIQVEIETTMFDEQGKFNLLALAQGSDELRLVWKKRLVELLKRFRADTKHDAGGYAEELAEDIFRWVNGGTTRGNIPRPNTIDDRKMVVLDELYFVSDQVDRHRILEDIREAEEVSPGLHRYVTVYGTTKINLNTADLVVLEAIFHADPDVAGQIIDRRAGTLEEQEDAEADESNGEAGASGEPFTDVLQVNELEGVTTEVLARNEVDLSRDFDVRSQFFSMWIVAKTEVTRRDELIVVERVPSSDPNAGLDGFRFLLHQERTDPLEKLDPTE